MPSQADTAPSWVFAPDLGDAGSELVLSAEESHYVARVCRAGIGDRVQATDGRGALATLALTMVAADVRARVETRRQLTRHATAEVWCGAPEGQRADWLIEKLAELGIAVWQPIDCERCEWRSSAVRLDRWERLAIAALRQSQRCHRMEVRTPVRIVDALAARPAHARGWLCDDSGDAPPAAISQGHAIGVIGPAPGFDQAEKARLESAGFQAMCLSDSRLRTETAAISWSAWWGLAGPARTLVRPR